MASIAAQVAGRLGLDVYDVEQAGGTLRVLLDRPGGIDIDVLTEANRQISRAIDEDPAVPAPATLEVSSPGLERRLRTPVHFAGAVGERVRVKTRPQVEGDRRADGVLVAADDRTITVDTGSGGRRTLAIDVIAKATTEFVWETTPKPGGGGRTKKGGGRSTDAPDDTATDQSEAIR
jgi:ribosome maturation factor RimP